MAETVGFIGLGNIGNPMARRVLGAGFPLVGYDVRPEALDRLVQAGAEKASSPKEVARRAQKICLSLNASSGMSFATQHRFPRFVLQGDFTHAGGMATELMTKDITTALGVGKEVGVPMPIAGLMQQLYHIAETMLGSKAPNQSTVQVYEQWAGVENRAT